MKIFNLIKNLFFVLGVAMLIGTYFLFKSTNEFLAKAISTEGKVIELVRKKSGNSSNNSISYHPLVSFVDQEGYNSEFLSSSGSNPPAYKVGEKVEILYNPESPLDAKINSFSPLWGGVAITGFLGTTFTLLGGVILWANKKKRDLQYHLLQTGKRIDADFQQVVVDEGTHVKGNHPYQIVAQWQNPVTSKIHLFKSENIWFNPTHFIKTNKIRVLIDSNNPNKYMVDLSFLPELSK